MQIMIYSCEREESSLTPRLREMKADAKREREGHGGRDITLMYQQFKKYLSKNMHFKFLFAVGKHCWLLFIVSKYYIYIAQISPKAKPPRNLKLTQRNDNTIYQVNFAFSCLYAIPRRNGKRKIPSNCNFPRPPSCASSSWLRRARNGTEERANTS